MILKISRGKKMKTFNDFFYNSENHKGFIETFDSVDNEKLTLLIGTHSSDDVRRYDIYIKSKIGFLDVSPTLETIDIETNNTLQEKQNEIINLFILLRFNELLKVKNLLTTDISANNGVVKNENKTSDTNSKNSVSAFNSDKLEEDNENIYNTQTNNVITEQKNNAKTIVSNIEFLTDFYKQSMIDKIIDYMKDLFTLQVID